VVRAAELRLGLSLPKALREWYLLYGNLSDVWNVQDQFLPPDELSIHDGRVVVYRENQNVVRWFIRASDLDAPDPPINVSDVDDDRSFHSAATAISEFAVQMLLLNAKFSRRALFRANGQVTSAALDAILEDLNRLPFPDLHWPPFPTRLYGNSDVLAELQAFTWLWITARDARCFDHLMRLGEEAGVAWEVVERP
jgi:hypothetical protein